MVAPALGTPRAGSPTLDCHAQMIYDKGLRVFPPAAAPACCTYAQRQGAVNPDLLPAIGGHGGGRRKRRP